MAKIHYSNYERHRSQKSYLIFYFTGMEPADFFERRLMEEGLEYERGEGKEFLKRHLFGIHQRDEVMAKLLNDEVGEHFQKPFLGSKGAAYFILFFTLLACLLAVVGYFLSN